MQEHTFTRTYHQRAACSRDKAQHANSLTTSPFVTGARHAGQRSTEKAHRKQQDTCPQRTNKARTAAARPQAEHRSGHANGMSSSGSSRSAARRAFVLAGRRCWMTNFLSPFGASIGCNRATPVFVLRQTGHAPRKNSSAQGTQHTVCPQGKNAVLTGLSQQTPHWSGSLKSSDSAGFGW